MLAELMTEAGTVPMASSRSSTAIKEAFDIDPRHPEIQAIGFVGSTPIAQYIYGRGRRTASACSVSAAPRTT